MYETKVKSEILNPFYWTALIVFITEKFTTQKQDIRSFIIWQNIKFKHTYRHFTRRLIIDLVMLGNASFFSCVLPLPMSVIGACCSRLRWLSLIRSRFICNKKKCSFNNVKTHRQDLRSYVCRSQLVKSANQQNSRKVIAYRNGATGFTRSKET